MNLNRVAKNFLGTNSIENNRRQINDLKRENTKNLMTLNLKGFRDNRREIGNLHRENLREIGKHDKRIISPYLQYYGSGMAPMKAIGRTFKGDENFFKSKGEEQASRGGIANFFDKRKQHKEEDRDLQIREREAAIQAKLNPQNQGGPTVVVNNGAPGQQVPQADPNTFSPQGMKVGAETESGREVKNKFLMEKNRNDSISDDDYEHMKNYSPDKLVAMQALRDENSIYGQPGEDIERYTGPGGGTTIVPKDDPGKRSLYGMFSRNLAKESRGLNMNMGGPAGDIDDQMLALGRLNQRYSDDFSRASRVAENELESTFDSRLNEMLLDRELQKSREKPKVERDTYNNLSKGLEDNMAKKLIPDVTSSSQQVEDVSKLLGAMNGSNINVSLNRKQAGIIADTVSRVEYMGYAPNANQTQVHHGDSKFEHDMLNSYLKRQGDTLLYKNYENPLPHQRAGANIDMPESGYAKRVSDKPVGRDVMKRLYQEKFPTMFGGDGDEQFR